MIENLKEKIEEEYLKCPFIHREYSCGTEDKCDVCRIAYDQGVEDGINRLMFALRNPVTLYALKRAKSIAMVNAIIKHQVDEIKD